MEILHIMEFAGTVAFAVTGALVAIEKDLDYYGIAFLSIITAVGGGILRDIIIDRTVPYTFVNPIYMIISLITAVLVILFYSHIVNLDRWIVFFDAAGLAAFSAIGCDVATEAGYGQYFLIITLSLLTGTGGGMIRDICAGETPFVLKKEVYAVASIAGAIGYIITGKYIPGLNPMYVCCGVTFAIRMICVKKDYHLRKVKRKEESEIF